MGGRVKIHWHRAAMTANGNRITRCSTGRQHSRFALRMPVLCGDPAAPDRHTFGSTQNVSRGGLLLESSEPLIPGTRTSLLLVTGERNARAEAMVVWMAESTPCRMGMRFITWLGTDRLSWERLLAFQAGPTPRTSVRLPISFDITCRVPPDIQVPGRVKNISDSGLMVALGEALPPHARVKMAVPPWISLLPVEAEMDVMWARAALEGPDVLHGFRFVWDDVDKELFLINALLQQVLDSDESFRGSTKNR